MKDRYKGLSAKEIAQKYNYKLSTTEGRIERGKKKLKECIKNKGYGE